MRDHWFDLLLAFTLAVIALSVGVTGVKKRSRKHLIAAAAGLAMAALLAFLHRSAFWPG